MMQALQAVRNFLSWENVLDELIMLAQVDNGDESVCTVFMSSIAVVVVVVVIE